MIAWTAVAVAAAIIATVVVVRLIAEALFNDRED